MTSSPALGSSEHAERLAIGALAKRGWPRLASLVAGQIASFGDSCWLTDARLGESIQRSDGRPYHTESIARVRRQLRDAKIIESTRVLPNGALPTQAKYGHSTRGTTIKRFNWAAIEQKNPFNRRERRNRRIEQAVTARAAGDIVRAAPKHAATGAIVHREQSRPLRTDDPHVQEILRLGEQGRAAAELREQREAARQRARQAKQQAEQQNALAPDTP
jgi:hypothetical protein